MTQPLTDVESFHDKFEIGYAGPPRLPDHALRMFRLRFLAEELTELGDALGVQVEVTMTPVVPEAALQLTAPDRLANALDALVDLKYVLLGTVSLLGFGRASATDGASIFDVAWDRVHAANMLKVRGRKPGRAFSDARWDVTKPPGWRSPDLSDLVTTR